MDTVYTGLVSTAGVALVAVINHLWKAFQAAQAEQTKAVQASEARTLDRLNKKDAKLDEANRAIVELAQKVGEARGYDEATLSIERKFEKLHEDVISAVRDNSKTS